MMCYKILRKISVIFDKLSAQLRATILRKKYPSLKLIKGKNLYIGKRCSIICVDGGQMILDNCFISEGVHLFCQKGAKLELSNCFIGRNAVIVALKEIIVKKDCEVAEMAVIRDQNHNHDLSDKPISEQGYKTGSIIINENVWIGAKATILKGSDIGKNSVVGAHSLVNKKFPEKSIIIGIPGKKMN